MWGLWVECPVYVHELKDGGACESGLYGVHSIGRKRLYIKYF
jgi:hypothetical protein